MESDSLPFPTAAQAEQYGKRVLGRGAARRAIERMKFEPGERVLDVGCGDGYITSELARRFSHCSFLGVDLSSQMIAYARREHSLQPNLEFAEDDAALLKTVADSSIDVLFSVSTTHWVFDQASLWAAFFRVLKPGGRIDVSTYPYNESEYKPIQLLANTPTWRRTYADFSSKCFPLEAPLAHLLTTEDLQGLLVSIGFDVSMCKCESRHYQIANTEEYIKMLAPWHPWIAHVPEGKLRDDFLADLQAEYRRYVRQMPEDGFVEAAPLPFSFEVLEVRAWRPAEPAASIVQGMAVQQTNMTRARFGMVAPHCDFTRFDERDVDYADPLHSKSMVAISVPIKDVGPGEVDFHSYGFDILDLPNNFRERLEQARRITNKDRSSRSQEEKRYMENNIGGGVKGSGAAAAIEKFIEWWASHKYDAPVVAVASASVKMRDSGPTEAVPRSSEGPTVDAIDPADRGAISPQPHVHTDYWDYEAALNRLRHPPEWKHNLALRVSPPAEYLLEVVSVWIPCGEEAMRDWRFGFVVGGDPEYIPVFLNGVRWASNIRLNRPDAATVWAMPDMKWGHAYVFRSAGSKYDAPHMAPKDVFAPPHTAFRVDPPPAIPFRRKSMEARVCIYRRPSGWVSKL